MTDPILSPNTESDNLKRCTKCGVEKPATTEYFYLENSSGRLRSKCRECCKRATRVYERANPRKLREARAIPKEVRPEQQKCTKCGEWKPATTEFFCPRKYHKSGISKHCRGCSRQRAKLYYDANRDRIREQDRNRILADPDKYKEKRRQYEASRTAERREYCRSYKLANREKLKERYREWQRANPDNVRARRHKRRSQKLQVGGTHTAADIKTQYNNQRGKCWWCGKRVGNKYEVDHRIPLSRGGSNGADNIVVSCVHCNRSKHDKMPWEWGDRLL